MSPSHSPVRKTHGHKEARLAAERVTTNDWLDYLERTRYTLERRQVLLIGSGLWRQSRLDRDPFWFSRRGRVEEQGRSKKATRYPPGQSYGRLRRCHVLSLTPAIHMSSSVHASEE